MDGNLEIKNKLNINQTNDKFYYLVNEVDKNNNPVNEANIIDIPGGRPRNNPSVFGFIIGLGLGLFLGLSLFLSLGLYLGLSLFLCLSLDLSLFLCLSLEIIDECLMRSCRGAEDIPRLKLSPGRLIFIKIRDFFLGAILKIWLFSERSNIF